MFNYFKKPSDSLMKIILGILFILIIKCSHGPDKPKNIILFIGDGMGVAQVTAGKTVKGSLHLERFPVAGLLTTHSANNFVTDSGAGGTALATGEKTNNWTLSISPVLDTMKTVLEYAEESGKSTGLVATCSMTGATPASFAVHVDDRDKHIEIASALVNSGVDLMMGGGLGYFLPSSNPKSLRNDEQDLVSQLEKRYQVVTDSESFREIKNQRGLYAFLATEDPPEAANRSISLAEFTRKAIEILSKNNEGFFLMVEGSQIDWAAHDNESERLIAEMIDFDEAVGVGLDFAEQANNTLVIATADHECGGYTLEDGSIDDKKITKPVFTSDWHTGVMVPLFAFGPGAAQFGGIHDNTFVGKTLIRLVKK
jgi:alkaline phosphatase